MQRTPFGAADHDVKRRHLLHGLSSIHMRSLLLALMIWSGSAVGAEIGPSVLASGRPISGVLIEGTIAVGDFAKFEAILLRRSNADPIWLASPGGDLSEAMKIGQLIRELKLSVEAPKESLEFFPLLRDKRNAVCASACFFVYAAGVYRSGSALGLHRPYFSREFYAARTLDDAAKSQAVAFGYAAEYLRNMGIEAGIVDRIPSIAANDILWLNEDQIKGLSGFIPIYAEWFRNKCQVTKLSENFPMAEQQAKCRIELLLQEQERAKFAWLLKTAPKSK